MSSPRETRGNRRGLHVVPAGSRRKQILLASAKGLAGPRRRRGRCNCSDAGVGFTAKDCVGWGGRSAVGSWTVSGLSRLMLTRPPTRRRRGRRRLRRCRSSTAGTVSSWLAPQPVDDGSCLPIRHRNPDQPRPMCRSQTSRLGACGRSSFPSSHVEVLLASRAVLASASPNTGLSMHRPSRALLALPALLDRSGAHRFHVAPIALEGDLLNFAINQHHSSFAVPSFCRSRSIFVTRISRFYVEP